MDIQSFLAEEKLLNDRRKKVIDSLLIERKAIDEKLEAVGYRPEQHKKRGRPKKELTPASAVVR